MVVVDASAVMRSLVLTSGTSEAALALSRQSLIAPAIIAIEIANALWRYVRAGSMDNRQAANLLAAARQTMHLVQEDANLVAEALELACVLRHPVYDCLYIELARRERTGLLTADIRLAERARQLRIAVELLP